jgi:hypothetical protein
MALTVGDDGMRAMLRRAGRRGARGLVAAVVLALSAGAPASAHPLLELVLRTAALGARVGARSADELATSILRNKAARDQTVQQIAGANRALGDELAKAWSLAEQGGMLDDVASFSVTRAYAATGEALGASTFRIEWAMKPPGGAISGMQGRLATSRPLDCTVGANLGILSLGTTFNSPTGCVLVGGSLTGALGCELLDLDCVEQARVTYQRILRAVTDPSPDRPAE